MEPESNSEQAGALLDGLLGSLLSDFRFWFERGQVLLEHCPDQVMPQQARLELGEQLAQASLELAAASSLRQAAPTPMALEMGTLAPWHKLVLEVWGLSARMRMAQVPMPELPPLPPLPGLGPP
ncbi:MAG: DUF2605 family protein [Prochlorococcaceae cyanobacterium]|jgi:hypothetical protein